MLQKNNSTKKRPISEIGEFGLIEKIKKSTNITNHSTNVLGIGDDAAIIDPNKQKVVITTDMLIEGTHFNLAYMPLPHLGFKAISVNISDLAAMNVIPTSVTVSLGLSSRFTIEAVEALYEGINLACKQYNIDLIGGDTCSLNTGLVISITAVGLAHENEIVKRKGGKANELLCITGDLAGAYMGLQVLERENALYKQNENLQPDLSEYSYIVGKQLKPLARLDIVHELKSIDVKPTTMIDISDGLASELLHLSKQNGLGVHIYEKEIPIEQDTFNTIAEFQLSPMTCALNGGEDYELLFSIKQKDLEKIKTIADVSIIGHYTDTSDKCLLINKANEVIPLKAQGWQHFEK